MLSVKACLQKLGTGKPQRIVGKLLSPPRVGAVIVIEFSDGLHEYVTTPVKRILKMAEGEVYFIETTNSRYRVELSASEELPLDNSAVR